MNITEFYAPKTDAESFKGVAGTHVYISEVLVGYTLFCYIYMLKTQHLLQRFLCSGVSFSKCAEDANPAGSKTQGVNVNVRLKIFKDVG